MTLPLVLFAAGALLELSLHLPGLWRVRKVLAAVSTILIAFASGWLMVWRPNLWSIVSLVISLYRIFNCLRIVKGRMHERYLASATLRTSLGLIVMQIAVAGIWLADGWGQTAWTVLTAGQLVLSLALLASLLRRLGRTAWPKKIKNLADSELPTLTVAIPARNETEDLQRCLESLVRSDYPKLEILVLDDCSQDRRTPEIIRGFAHDGVRFLEGEEPKKTWTAKNQAYEQLAREASGQYILFCGVDVRFGRQSLREVTNVMTSKNKRMMSLLPYRAASAERRFAVIQAMRYAWELVPLRRLFRRPPVLSTCWIVQKEALAAMGGLKSVSRAIVPEARFARQLTARGGYSFLRAAQNLGIESVKPAREQYQTAIRMRYPQLHKRPENVFVLSVIYTFGLLAAFALPLLGFLVDIGSAAQIISACAALVLTVVFLLVAGVTRTGTPWLGPLSAPFGLVSDLVLLHISMWQYEFSVVEWKGRNICIPAMHVYPHLPKV
jgi:hypothetical protein